MKKLYVVLFALILLVSGCNKQLENGAKVSNEPENTQVIASSASVDTSLPSYEPTKTNDKDNIADQVSQLLPEGTVNASVLKRIYVYNSERDENREKELEKKYRNTIEKNWDKILENANDAGKRLFEQFYHKDVDFRDNITSVFKNYLFPSLIHNMNNEMGMSNDEYWELRDLYDSAKEKVIEDFNTSLTINKGDSKIEITTDDKPKLIKGVKIDFSNKTLKLGNGTFEQIVDNDKINEFSKGEFFLRKSSYNDKKIETKFLWYQGIDIDHFNFFAVSKIGDTNQIVLRYLILDFTKNKYTEEMILIKADK